MVPGVSISVASAASAPSSPGSGLSLSPALPLSFIGAGLGFLVAAVAVLAVHPTILGFPYPHPHLVALVHLWLPGFLLTLCMGACYQLAPVILGAKLAGRRGPWGHLSVHVIGVVMLASGLAGGRYLWAAWGGILVTVGTVYFAGVIIRTFITSSRRDAVAWSLPLAVGWLVLTTLAGVLAAANRHEPWLPLSILSLLGAHAHLGLFGFFVTLLQGVTFQLVPMFTLGQVQLARCVAVGLGATQVGLPGIVVGLAVANPPLLLAGSAIVALGLGCTLAALIRTLARRRKRRWEVPMIAFCTGWGLLLVAGIQVGTTRLGAGSWVSVQTTATYGYLLIPGALTLMIMGMLLKIVPFLTWMKAYGHAVGRQPIPRATELSHSPSELAWFSLHIAGLIMGITALMSAAPGDSWLIPTAAWLWVGGLACYLGNISRIAAHLFSPQTTPQP